ncbi:MAG: T9SS C-terminal target domain-containing protein, partial [Verrucomicrobiota bacterium]
MKKILLSLLTALAIQNANASTVNISGSLTGTNNWLSTNTYLLTGPVYVLSNAVLNIEAGTVIKGQTNATAANISFLAITRGAKIFANGTANSPIIFTSVLDDVTDPFDLPIYQRGLWGGVILFGNAKINTASDAAGNAASPKYDVYEGLADTQISGQFVHRFGGTNDDDSSGVFRYVSIRHGGKVLESNKEINGLSLGAVGRGTTIEYVEAYAIGDDGFEFFGGTVNCKYLVSAFNDDDTFDADQGYSGKLQFLFSIQEPGARDKGWELNGEPSGIAVGASPTMKMEVYNATTIGAGTNGGGSANNAFTIREFASPSFYNCIFTDYSQRGL